MIEWSRRRVADGAAPLQIRLVKGAYWDAETIAARANGWPSPVWTDKAETDRNYERLTGLLMAAAGAVRPAIASHNVRSIAYAAALARAIGLPAMPGRCRCCTAWPSPCTRPFGRAACGCGCTARSASWFPAWRTSSGGCSRTRPTNRSCATASATGTSPTAICRRPRLRSRPSTQPSLRHRRRRPRRSRSPMRARPFVNEPPGGAPPSRRAGPLPVRLSPFGFDVPLHRRPPDRDIRDAGVARSRPLVAPRVHVVAR